jgi:prepilin-type N-terminal cleavage/methylation domain-containing protein
MHTNLTEKWRYRLAIARGRGKRNSRAFTVVEMLVVLLITAIFMAIALPAFINAMADSRAKACRNNMQVIANNEREYKIKSSTHSYATTISALSSVLPIVPVCSEGGTYTLAVQPSTGGTLTAQNGQTLPPGAVLVSCSASGHGKFALDIDSY